jgi:hypothetical protein
MNPPAFRLGRRIVKVETLPDLHVRVTYDDGFSGTLDFRPYIEWGDAAKPLRDPALFARAHIGPGGVSLAWTASDGQDIDFCADAVRMDLEGLRSLPTRNAMLPHSA